MTECVYRCGDPYDADHPDPSRCHQHGAPLEPRVFMTPAPERDPMDDEFYRHADEKSHLRTRLAELEQAYATLRGRLEDRRWMIDLLCSISDKPNMADVLRAALLEGMS